MGRLRDALRVLQGRSESQVEIARMKTQWAGLMLDVANLMDKLASMVGRLSKRESLKATKKLEPKPEVAVVQGKPQGRWAQKAALRRRRLGQGAPIQEPVEPTEAEEAEG